MTEAAEFVYLVNDYTAALKIVDKETLLENLLVKVSCVNSMCNLYSIVYFAFNKIHKHRSRFSNNKIAMTWWTVANKQ